MPGIIFDSGTVATLGNAIQSQRRLKFDTVREENRQKEFDKTLAAQEEQFTQGLFADQHRQDEQTRQFDADLGLRQATLGDTQERTRIESRKVDANIVNQKGILSNQTRQVDNQTRQLDAALETDRRNMSNKVIENGHKGLVTTLSNASPNGNPIEGASILQQSDPETYNSVVSGVLAIPEITTSLITANGRNNPARKDAKFYGKTSPITGRTMIAWRNKDGKEVFLSANGKAVAENSDEPIVDFDSKELFNAYGRVLQDRGLQNQVDELRSASQAVGAELDTSNSIVEMVDGLHTQTRGVSADLQQPDDGRFGPAASAPQGQPQRPPTDTGFMGTIQKGIQQFHDNVGTREVVQKYGQGFNDFLTNTLGNPDQEQSPQQAPQQAPQQQFDPFAFGKNVTGAASLRNLGENDEAVDVLQGKDVGDARTLTQIQKEKKKEGIRLGDPDIIAAEGKRLERFASKALSQNSSKTEVGKLFADLTQTGFNGSKEDLHQAVITAAQNGITVDGKTIDDWGPREYTAVAGQLVEADNEDFKLSEFIRRKGYRIFARGIPPVGPAIVVGEALVKDKRQALKDLSDPTPSLLK